MAQFGVIPIHKLFLMQRYKAIELNKQFCIQGKDNEIRRNNLFTFIKLNFMSEDTKKILRQWQENLLIMSNELKEVRKIIKEWEDKTGKIHTTVENKFFG